MVMTIQLQPFLKSQLTHPQAAAISPTTPVPAPNSMIRLFSSPSLVPLLLRCSFCKYFPNTSAASQTTQLSSPTSACLIFNVPCPHSISLSNVSSANKLSSLTAILMFWEQPLTKTPTQSPLPLPFVPNTNTHCVIPNNVSYYPTSLRRVQITPKTSTNITRYLYSRGPVRQVFSQRASDEFDSSHEKKFCLSIGISFLRFFLTEILK